MNVASFLSEGIQKYGEYELLIYLSENSKVVLSNVEIDKRSRAVAGGFQKMGIKRGDIVGVMVSNIPEILEMMIGAWRMGATFLPIIYMLTPNEIRYIIEDSRISVLITEAKQWPKIKEALEGHTTVQKVVIIGNGVSDERVISYDDFKVQENGTEEIVDLDPDEIGILMYTSGSTGFPKGVMLSHKNLTTSQINGLKVWPFEKSRIYVSTPMNHIYGTIYFIYACITGSTMILVPWFDPVKSLEIITEYKVGVAPLVPTMIIMMLANYNPEKHNLKSLKYMVCAGAPLAEETLVKAQETFGVTLFHGYGLTEAGSNVCFQYPDRPFKRGSVGLPIPEMQVKLVDDEGREVPQGESGEIIIKGPNVTRGYWNKPQETAAAIRNGWLHTGDLGRFDEDGELYIVGRKKDLIIKGGENLDPGISENVLLKNPAVLEVATIAIPDPKYGEEVGSAVVLKPGQTATEAELIQFAKQFMHHFAAPKRIFIMETLPKTGTGKVLKREIREIVKSLV